MDTKRFSPLPDGLENLAAVFPYCVQASAKLGQKGAAAMNARLPKSVFIVVVVYAAIHFSSYYSQLPAVVASHFDAHGTANGWQTKQAFFSVFVAVTLLGAVLVFVLPALIAIVPRQFINLPNKDYWLSPERLEASHQFPSQAVESIFVLLDILI